MRWPSWLVTGSTLLLLANGLWAENVEPLHRQARLRRPLALVMSGDYLLAANRSGSVSVLDVRRLSTLGEYRVGERLSALVALDDAEDDEGRLLALDERAHALLVLTRDQETITLRHRIPVSPYPVSLSLIDSGERAIVAGLWSRRLDLVRLPDEGSPRVADSLQLPFAPRQQVVLPGDEKLLVADASGGRVALVDVPAFELERVLELPAHNIRGMTLSEDGRRVLLTHQSVDRAAKTNRDDIIWGVLMANRLTSLRMDSLLDETRDPLRGARQMDLGDFFATSGDPQQVVVTNREVVVALGGVGKIGIGRERWPRLDTVQVGRRPTAIATDDDGRVYVANTFSDSVTVVDSRARKPLGEIALGPMAELSDEDKGELLFYDATVSLRGWMSCNTCHSDGHANGQVTDTLGDGSYGTPKRVPSLLGVGRTAPYAWNGMMPTLEAQIAKSQRTTLRGRELSAGEIAALASYLRTLEPPELPPDGDAEGLGRGEVVFREAGCHGCHKAPTYTSKFSRDVGLKDEAGNRRFNPPSLRGVRHRSSFLHDGRAKSLRDVFAVYGHPGLELSARQIDDLLVYLSSI